MADASAWIGKVAMVARDHMEVQMHHRLPRGFARVEADVVPVGGELGVEGALDLVEEIEAQRLSQATHPYTRGLLGCLPKIGGPRGPLPTLARDAAWSE